MKESLEKKIEYWLNGNIKYEYHLNKKGQKHGSHKEYWLNRSLCTQTEFKNNQVNGFYKEKWGNGSFNYIDTRKKNERFGLMVDFI